MKGQKNNSSLQSYSETETEKVIVGYKETDGQRVPVYEERPVVDYSNALSLDDMMEKVNIIFRLKQRLCLVKMKLMWLEA